MLVGGKNEPMTTVRSRQDEDEQDRPPSRLEEDCEELLLLVPSWQLAALEQAARGQELTIGQLLRRLIATHLLERSLRPEQG